MRGSTAAPKRSRSSDSADVARLRTLRTGLDVELDALVLYEVAVAVAGNADEVDEDIAVTLVGGDEAEALFAVEPLHGSLGHADLHAERTGRTPRAARVVPTARLR